MILQPQANADHVQFMNGVDQNDCDSADYSTSVLTNRYYLQTFCWGLGRFLHVVCCCVFPSKGRYW